MTTWLILRRSPAPSHNGSSSCSTPPPSAVPPSALVWTAYQLRLALLALGSKQQQQEQLEEGQQEEQQHHPPGHPDPLHQVSVLTWGPLQPPSVRVRRTLTCHLAMPGCATSGPTLLVLMRWRLSSGLYKVQQL